MDTYMDRWFASPATASFSNRLDREKERGRRALERKLRLRMSDESEGNWDRLLTPRAPVARFRPRPLAKYGAWFPPGQKGGVSARPNHGQAWLSAGPLSAADHIRGTQSARQEHAEPAGSASAPREPNSTSPADPADALPQLAPVPAWWWDENIERASKMLSQVAAEHVASIPGNTPSRHQVMEDVLTADFVSRTDTAGSQRCAPL
jgi:hypothetical protein